MIILPRDVNEIEYIDFKIVDLEDGFNLDLTAIIIQHQR